MSNMSDSILVLVHLPDLHGHCASALAHLLDGGGGAAVMATTPMLAVPGGNESGGDATIGSSLRTKIETENL